MQNGVRWIPHNHDGHWFSRELFGAYSGVHILQKEGEPEEKVFLALHWISGADGPVRTAPDQSHCHISVPGRSEMGEHRHRWLPLLLFRGLYDNFWIVRPLPGQCHGDRKSHGDNEPALVLQPHEDKCDQTDPGRHVSPRAALCPAAHRWSRGVSEAVAGHLVLHQHRGQQSARKHHFCRHFRRAWDFLSAGDFVLQRHDDPGFDNPV